MDWLCIGAAFSVLSLCALFLWSRGAKYAAIYGLEHHRELAGGLHRVVDKAQDPAGRQPEHPDAMPAFVSSRGIAVAYTVDRRDDAFLHHLSVSEPGGWLARVAAVRLLAFLALSLGLELNDRVLYQMKTGVVHLVIRTAEPVPRRAEIGEGDVRGWMERSASLQDALMGELRTIVENAPSA